jgi:branched-chain amino acid transport system ATP-binding protein
MKPVLALENVTAGYGPTVIIENLSLSLEAGDVLAVLGRNGVGKSTLMKTIVGQTRLHRGEIRLKGQSIGQIPSYRRALAGIGFVPQERDIFGTLTNEENLRIAAREGRWTVEGIFELFPNLAGRRHNHGDEISGGEQQMLSIGRALVGNPSVLLLDEPMEGLAPVIIDQILKVLHTLRSDGGMVIVFVEQYALMALEFAPRTIVLDRGRAIFDGRSNELSGNPELMASCLGLSGAIG